MKNISSDKASFSYIPLESNQGMLNLAGAGKNSSQKSSRSTYISDCSVSRKKLMIPKSQKLAHFFNTSRPQHKSYSTSSTEYMNLCKKKSNPEQHQSPKQKYNINTDYFDSYTQHNLRGNLQKLQETKSKTIKFNHDKAQQQIQYKNSQHDRNAYASLTILQKKRQKCLPKLKIHTNHSFPGKPLINPIQKLMVTKDEKVKMIVPKNGKPLISNKQSKQSCKQLQYTFGLHF